MSSEQGEMTPAVPPLEDENLLSEILLRLPPLPSSLPRSSAVCKRWRSLASDPAFSRRFRRHHRRNPPLLGCFYGGRDGLQFFESTLEAPNRVPRRRFSLQFDNKGLQFFGCRHGLVLIFDYKSFQFLVWDPVTGQQHRLATPPTPRFDPTMVNAAVLRSAAAGDQHFKVVLVVTDGKDRRILACVYLSETGVWGNLITTPIPCWDFRDVSAKPAVLVGGSLYWDLITSPSSMLEFDVETESLSVIRMPSCGRSDDFLCTTVMPAEGGGMGLVSISDFTTQLWKRKTDSDGVVSWEMGRTIELDALLSLNSDDYVAIRGLAEGNNLVILYTDVSLFTFQFESLQFKKLTKPQTVDYCHPFESVYAAGI